MDTEWISGGVEDIAQIAAGDIARAQMSVISGHANMPEEPCQKLSGESFLEGIVPVFIRYIFHSMILPLTHNHVLIQG